MKSRGMVQYICLSCAVLAWISDVAEGGTLRRRLARSNLLLRATELAPKGQLDRLLENVATEVPTEVLSDTDTEEGTENPTEDGTVEWWEVGTHVYKQFDDGWYFGIVTDYSEDTATYTIQYDDGETETYPFASEELDNMVEQANNYVGYEEGTRVFRDEDGATGKIIRFQDWVYTIGWDETEAVENFDNIMNVISMVEAAKNLPDETPPVETEEPTELDPWESGTYVRKEVGDDWLFGTVASYNIEDDLYEVIYEDGSSESFNYDSTELDQLVENANSYEGYDPNTPVMVKSGNEWISGTIVRFDDWVYYVKWEDGDENEYSTIRTVDAMVAAAAANENTATESSSGTVEPSDEIVSDEPTIEPTDEATDEPTDEPTDAFDNDENDDDDGWNNSWNTGGTNSQPGIDKDEDGLDMKTYSIVAVFAAFVLVIFIVRRRRTRSYKNRFRRAELIAQDYDERSLHMELPDMD